MSDEETRLMAAGKRPLKVGNNGTFEMNAVNASHPGTVVFHEASGADDDETNYTLFGQFHTALFSLWQIKLLLVFVPLMFAAKWFGSADGPLFIFSFFALIPLAALLGDFTEDICKRSNEVIGALINVTFGNATELIISFMALRAGLFQLIKFALIGSILGNMLLVLGTGLLLGGLKRKVLRFSVEASNTYIPLLMLSVMSFLIPSGYGMTVPHHTVDEKAAYESSVLSVSRCIALITAVVYLCYLWFQLVSHKDLFDDTTDSSSKEGSVAGSDQGSDAGSDDESPDFTLTFALVGLGVVSILISYASDVLVDSVQGAAVEYGVPSQFIGLILVPIVGNAAEHATAVIMAQKGRLDVAVGVALGSSIQIALFVMPVLVLSGWIAHIPLDMNFHPFATAVLLVCTLVCSQIIADGKSNWLEGVMLVGAYIMVGVTVFHGDLMA